MAPSCASRSLSVRAIFYCVLYPCVDMHHDDAYVATQVLLANLSRWRLCAPLLAATGHPGIGAACRRSSRWRHGRPLCGLVRQEADPVLHRRVYVSSVWEPRTASRRRRHRGELTALAVCALGCFGAAASPSLIIFCLTRFAVGLAVGSASTVAPLYISETSSSAKRGRLVTLFQISVRSSRPPSAKSDRVRPRSALAFSWHTWQVTSSTK